MKIVVASDLHQPNPRYLAALVAAGALPDRLELVVPGDPLPARFDGLLLAGGADVAPSRYGEDVLHRDVEVREERDALDLALLERALSCRVPVLGICRGLQVLNVAFGGTLWQDLPSQRDRGIRHAYDREDGFAPDLLAHTVRSVPGTDAGPLRETLAGEAPLGVNSRHHQAVKALAPGLVAVAESPDGLVEALIGPEGPYLAAVQWHPEDLVHDPLHLALFRGFLAALSR